ncbi:MAG: hypothetical protein ACKVOM_02300 [Ferruginibacter sp.]
MALAFEWASIKMGENNFTAAYIAFFLNFGHRYAALLIIYLR